LQLTTQSNFVHPLDQVVYYLIYTNSGSSTAINAVLTDNLPESSTMSYVAGTATNGGIYNSSNNSLSWNIGSISPGASVTVSYEASVVLGDSAGMTLTTQANLKDSNQSINALNSVVVVGGYQITISIYNDSGELVKTINEFTMSSDISNFTTEINGIIGDSISSYQDNVSFEYNGNIIGSWNLTNSAGGTVINGTYFVKIDSTNAFGSTTSITKSLTVLAQQETLQISVYNEAGEEVKLFSTAEINQQLGSPLEPSDFQVSTIHISPSIIHPSYTQPLGVGNYTIITLGSGRSLTWTGRSNTGIIVSNGQYFIEIRAINGSAVDGAMILPISVLSTGYNFMDQVLVAPNPIHLNSTYQARILVPPNGNVFNHVNVKIYTVDGELIETLENAPGTMNVIWPIKGVSPLAVGTYLIDVELRYNNALVQRKILKAFIIP
jgi:uncharacterized repeat protein (TIGR01451 family)